MRARKVGRWCVRLSVVFALGAAAFAQTPAASAAVDTGILSFVDDLGNLVTPPPAPSQQTGTPEDYGWD